MTPSEIERRPQLRHAQWKLGESQKAAEKRGGDEHPRGEGEWRDLVERRIREAMADGVFDNLPGEGQPLDLSRNPYLDPSLELAYSLLKNNGYSPEWIARDKEIREELEAARTRLRAAWTQRQVHPTDKTAWEAALARFEEALTQLNRKIDDYNLIVPISGCQRVRLRLADELRRLNHE
jgi:DnaJ family protein C protein 28